MSKKVLPIAALAAAAALLSSCASLFPTRAETFPAWEGPPPLDPAASALFSYGGTGGYGLVLYAVDDQPRTRMGDPRLLEGAYTNTLMCGFDVAVQPGEHSFQFYTVDTDPLELFVISFKLEAGRTYTLAGKSKAFTIREGDENGKEIGFDRRPAAEIAEPAESEPHAVLRFARDEGAMDANAWILRIDGRIRQPMYKRHPRWVVMNYSGLASGIVNATMRIQANVEAEEGAFSIRLSPGRHRVEYIAETMFLASRLLSDSVRIIDYDFEAGRTYDIIVTPDAEKDPFEKIILNGARIEPAK